MITSSDYKKIIRDIETRAKENVVSNITDLKKDYLHIVVKAIKRSPLIRDQYNNFMVYDYDFAIVAKGHNIDMMTRILNLEFRLVKDLNIMREDEYSIAKGVEVKSGNKTLRYALMDNDEDPEDNEVDKNVLNYKKVYNLKIMYKN